MNQKVKNIKTEIEVLKQYNQEMKKQFNELMQLANSVQEFSDSLLKGWSELKIFVDKCEEEINRMEAKGIFPEDWTDNIKLKFSELVKNNCLEIITILKAKIIELENRRPIQKYLKESKIQIINS